MPIVVQKYGGTSVGDAERIRAVADRVVRTREERQRRGRRGLRHGRHHRRALAMAHEITARPNAARARHAAHRGGADRDVAARRSRSTTRGCRARRYTGSQAGIITDTRTAKAKIIDIRPGRILEALERGHVVDRRRVPGHLARPARHHHARPRGLGHDGGGAGRRARAPSAARSTPTSTGVFTADPRVVPGARKLHACQLRGDARAGGGRRAGPAVASVEYARRTACDPRAVVVHRRAPARGSTRRTNGWNRR